MATCACMDGLDEYQVKAASHYTGPALVSAGAGSGKTTTIVRRIVHLIRCHGVDPESILAVTFTRKAATEMRQRVQAMLGEDTDVMLKTWHSWALAVVKRYDKEYSGRRLATSDKQLGYFVHLATKNAGMSAVNSDDFLMLVGIAKNSGIEASNREGSARIFERHAQQFATGLKDASQFVSLYQAFEKVLEEKECMTHDDTMLRCVLLLQNNMRLAMNIASRYKFLIQDEAQDQNLAQAIIGRILTIKHRNYMMVGDFKQSIYKFRGATPEGFLAFIDEYSVCKVYHLAHNYRSAPQIVERANVVASLMSDGQEINESMIPKSNAVGSIVVRKFGFPQEESSRIAEEAHEYTEHNEGKTAAILARTNGPLIEIEIELIKRQIPYARFGNGSIMGSGVTKTFVQYLRIAANTGNKNDLKAIVNTPLRYVPNTFVDKAAEFHRKGVDWIDAMRDAARQTLRFRAAEKIESLCLAMMRLREKANRDTALRMLEALDGEVSADERSNVLYEALTDFFHACGLSAHIEENDLEPAPIIALIHAASGSMDLTSLIELYDKIERASRRAAEKSIDDSCRIMLSTIHSFKGLEADRVYLVRANDMNLPHKKSLDQEEELRLFYVAITRPRESLVISSPVTHITATGNIKTTGLSPFVSMAGIRG